MVGWGPWLHLRQCSLACLSFHRPATPHLLAAGARGRAEVAARGASRRQPDAEMKLPEGDAAGMGRGVQRVAVLPFAASLAFLASLQFPAGAAEASLRPLWWHAPFLSGGGYSSEALSYVLALAQEPALRSRLWIAQHGDGVSGEAVAGDSAACSPARPCCPLPLPSPLPSPSHFLLLWSLRPRPVPRLPYRGRRNIPSTPTPPSPLPSPGGRSTLLHASYRASPHITPPLDPPPPAPLPLAPPPSSFARPLPLRARVLAHP